VTIADEIIAALDQGASQREVAAKLGRSQSWVNTVARSYLRESGQTRWWNTRTITNDVSESFGALEGHEREAAGAANPHE